MAEHDPRDQRQRAGSAETSTPDDSGRGPEGAVDRVVNDVKDSVDRVAEKVKDLLRSNR